jgi:hypothetical protein
MMVSDKVLARLDTFIFSNARVRFQNVLPDELYNARASVEAFNAQVSAAPAPQVNARVAQHEDSRKRSRDDGGNDDDDDGGGDGGSGDGGSDDGGDGDDTTTLAKTDKKIRRNEPSILMHDKSMQKPLGEVLNRC